LLCDFHVSSACACSTLIRTAIQQIIKLDT
jgi:hypothetical protein